jgi:hypothetical protein
MRTALSRLTGSTVSRRGLSNPLLCYWNHNYKKQSKIVTRRRETGYSMLSKRLLTRGSGLVILLTFSGLAAAQSPTTGTDIELTTVIGLRVGITLILNLVLGGALVLFGPRYATKMVTELYEYPGRSFGWGLLVGIGVPIGLVLIGLTIIGLLITIPGLLLLIPVGLVGSAVTTVWIGDLLTGHTGTVGGKAAGVGAVALAVLAVIPILGNLFISLAGFFGLGVVGRNLYTSWRG